MTRKKNTKQINMRLNRDIVDKVDEVAKRRRTTRTAVVERAVMEHLDISPEDIREYVEEDS